MYLRPTTEQVLLGVARDLREQVLPHVVHEPARVALGMIDQLLRGCALRAAHEIAWATEEEAAIRSVAGGVDDPAVRSALAELDAGAVDSLHLEDVAARYHLASRVLSACLEAAYRREDGEQIAAARGLLEQRTEREQEVIGSLDLVGRG